MPVAPGPPASWVVLGLGNPPARGGPVRANAGAIVLEAIAGTAPFRRSGIAEVCPVRILDVSVNLVRLSVFMDRSGPAIAQYLHEAQIPPTNLIVLHDDDETLELGSLRIRTRGPAGVHRGMASVLRALGVVEVPRIRIGTGLPPLASRRLDLAAAEVERLRVIARGVTRAIRLLVVGHADAAMSLYNRRDRDIDSLPGLVRAFPVDPS